VGIIIKWVLAAIPATIVLMIIFFFIGLVITAIFGGIIGLNFPNMPMQIPH
jgi:hypothetical protein